MPDLAHTSLESLEVGAAPLLAVFLQRLQLHRLLQQFLPAAPTGCPEKLSTATTLCALVCHLLLARQPLYALADWFARRVPEPVGLHVGDLSALNDDRFGHALDRLAEADLASLLTALVLQTLREFRIDVKQLHNDSTTVTFSGRYENQPPADQADRPPRITRGFNKDHRPDLNQLLYCVTVSADGAVPIHFKTYDGNTSDDTTHKETWLFLCQLVGSPDFLYVADCKLCSHENLELIAGKNGRFLTPLPRTWKERQQIQKKIQTESIPWPVVRRHKATRRQQGTEVVYEGFESMEGTESGYRVLCYRSSQKRAADAEHRDRCLERFRRWWQTFGSSKRNRFKSEEKALAKGQALLGEKKVKDWVAVRVQKQVRQWKEQVGRGRPGPDTQYRQREQTWWELVLEEDSVAIAAAAKVDGVFCLLTNDKGLSVADALAKYKYQPCLEKRFEQLKTVFEVAPMWLKNPERIASLLFVYYIVLLVEALVERELRQKMKAEQIKSLPLYPEQRQTRSPTAELVFNALEGHRRHRLLSPQGDILRTFYDPLPEVAQQLLRLLGVDRSAYGID